MKGRKGGGREGVGVVKDEEIKFAERVVTTDTPVHMRRGGTGRVWAQKRYEYRCDTCSVIERFFCSRMGCVQELQNILDY